MKSFLFIGAFFCLTRSIWSQDPLVMTRQGLIRGSRSSNGEYSSFFGIPYATVDRDNPFGDALPAPIFDHIFDAHDDSAICPHREEFNDTIVGTLDCLQLHVYVPSAASSTNRLPVMVWIHGGGYETGWAGPYVYGPEYLVRHDVILVTLNYRLGPYGFLCLDIPSVPGNTGLKDQRAALHWVHDNIAAFGGDDNSITIFGESAGAMSVEMHILSPGSKGLFHHAILESGTVFLPGLMKPSNPTAPMEIAKKLRFNTEDVYEALEFLKTVTTVELIQAHEELGVNSFVCVEKSFEGVDQFLGESPLHLLETGQYVNVPMLLGYNSDEMLFTYLVNLEKNPNYFETLQNKFTDVLDSTFTFESPEQLEVAAKIIQDFYIGRREINKNVLNEMANLDSDFMMNYPMDKSLNYYLNEPNNTIYQYVFGFSGENNFLKQRLNVTEGGAAHADEIGFLFKQAYLPDTNSPEDQIVIDRMTKMWTNFAKYGDPTPETSELLPVRWPAATLAAREYLWIDSDLQVDRKPVHQKVAFWELFFLTFRQYFWMT